MKPHRCCNCAAVVDRDNALCARCSTAWQKQCARVDAAKPGEDIHLERFHLPLGYISGGRGESPLP